MPRFYFDLRQAEDLIHDEEGEELPDVSAARCEAGQTALAVGRERITENNLIVAIEVRDEKDQKVARAVLTLHVE